MMSFEGGTVAEIAARNGQIAEKRAQGMTFRSIAAELSIDERTARRAYSDFVAHLGEHTPGSSAVYDTFERIDHVVAEAQALYDRYKTRNTNAAIGALRTILRAQTVKVSLLALVGASEQDAARWQADRQMFKQFVEIGVSLWTRVERDEISVAEAREQFGAALGLLDGDDGSVPDSPPAPSDPWPDLSPPPAPDYLREMERRRQDHGRDPGGGEGR
jgi:hypothetical protein